MVPIFALVKLLSPGFSLLVYQDPFLERKSNALRVSLVKKQLIKDPIDPQHTTPILCEINTS